MAEAAAGMGERSIYWPWLKQEGQAESFCRAFARRLGGMQVTRILAMPGEGVDIATNEPAPSVWECLDRREKGEKLEPYLYADEAKAFERVERGFKTKEGRPMRVLYTMPPDDKDGESASAPGPAPPPPVAPPTAPPAPSPPPAAKPASRAPLRPPPRTPAPVAAPSPAKAPPPAPTTTAQEGGADWDEADEPEPEPEDGSAEPARSPSNAARRAKARLLVEFVCEGLDRGLSLDQVRLDLVRRLQGLTFKGYVEASSAAALIREHVSSADAPSAP